MVDAGKNLTTLVPGGCFVHHADAFLMIRGGHLDVSLLGAFEVSERAILRTGPPKTRPSRPASAAPWIWRSAPGKSASSWSTPARRVSRAILKHCTYPLTAAGCRQAHLHQPRGDRRDRQGLVVAEMVPGMTLAEAAGADRAEAATGRQLAAAGAAAPEARAA